MFARPLLKWELVLGVMFLFFYSLAWWTNRNRSASLAIALTTAVITYLSFFSILTT